jgi:ABC-type branched-subunit amino acid transport system substrate-binding protein
MGRRWELYCLALLVGSCGPRPQVATRTLSLGAVIDRSGNNAEPSWADAIRLAERNANAGLKMASVLNDLRVSVLLADSGNEPSVALSRCTELVKNQGVKALILDTSQVDVAVNRTFYDADPGNDLNVPIQCGSCTSGTINNPSAVDADPVTQAALRNNSKWNFRSIMSTRLESMVLMRLLLAQNNGDANSDGKFKLSYFGSDEVFGKGTVKDLKSYAQLLHPDPPPIIEEIYHPRDADPNSYDWAAQARSLTDNQTAGVVDGFPDALVVANFIEQQAAFVKAYKQDGYNVPLMNYHTFRISSGLQSLGSLAEGIQGISHVLLDGGPAGEAFRFEYEDRYGVPVVYRDAIYYDNAMTLMLAMVIAAAKLPDPTQVTGQQIRDALPQASVAGGSVIHPGPEEFARAVELIAKGMPINYAGASGPMDYDANGNVVGRLALYRAEGGQFVDVAIFDCVSDLGCPQLP